MFGPAPGLGLGARAGLGLGHGWGWSAGFFSGTWRVQLSRSRRALSPSGLAELHLVREWGQGQGWMSSPGGGAAGHRIVSWYSRALSSWATRSLIAMARGSKKRTLVTGAWRGVLVVVCGGEGVVEQRRTGVQSLGEVVGGGGRGGGGKR